MKDDIHAVLAVPGTVTFPSNQRYVTDLAAAGGRMVRTATTHLVFYGADGRRFLATDPEGHPLHECEWGTDGAGQSVLRRARLHLDWDGWVGLVPGGLVHATTLDLTRRPGWQRVGPDDLRRMAAQAVGVPFEEVRFFYRDDDLLVDPGGQATIRHRKDAFYVLEDGRFGVDRPGRFMSCMGAMHWDRVDFLPVVELFQSLLPGTGSAAFELIRGLYDDAYGAHPEPLRYRGIPTYPSEAAFRLFSQFFTPHVAGGGSPFERFMDAPRAHEVLWLPAPDPPRRYFHPEVKMSATLRGDRLQKVVRMDDPAGLPYTAVGRGPAAGGRRVSVAKARVLLEDGRDQTSVDLPAVWGAVRQSDATGDQPPTTWRDLFAEGAPAVEARRAFAAVLLYPDDDTEIGEVESHPFVGDHLEDLAQSDAAMGAAVTHSDSVLIDNFDGAIAACVPVDRPRRITVWYGRPEYAQRQAQMLWGRFVQAGHADWLASCRFRRRPPRVERMDAGIGSIYSWLPFEDFKDRMTSVERLTALGSLLTPAGHLFAVGPRGLGDVPGCRLIAAVPVEELPPFRMHRSVLPRARLRSGLTLYVLRRR